MLVLCEGWWKTDHFLAAWCQPLPPPTALDTSVAVGEMAELVCSVMGYSGSVPVSVSIMKMSDPRSLR